MAKRQRLPAPPLVLSPIFGRYPVGGSGSDRLIELARFLQGRNLLTDGGAKSLNNGLQGRNFVVSLGLQDVRSHAHGLVQELMKRPSQDWASFTEEYFQTYDKGKPRRPTHLQRLYIDWSRDLSWPGLLQACHHHPNLWAELDLALDRLDDDSLDSEMLDLARRCRGSLDLWEQAFENQVAQRKNLLVLLRLLTPHRILRRLSWLERTAHPCSGKEDWAIALITACHCDFPQARQLRRDHFNGESLERLALECLDQEQFEPLFVSSFRSFVQSRATIDTLLAAIPQSDPLRYAVYGARPGTSWLEAQKQEMLQLIELR
jgi:hypothetical protein